MMLLAVLGRGRRTHAVVIRPDLDPRWRAVCGRARSNTMTPSTERPDPAHPPCQYCLDTLRTVAADLEGRR